MVSGHITDRLRDIFAYNYHFRQQCDPEQCQRITEKYFSRLLVTNLSRLSVFV